MSGPEGGLGCADQACGIQVLRLLPPRLTARRLEESYEVAFGRFEFIDRNQPRVVDIEHAGKCSKETEQQGVEACRLIGREGVEVLKARPEKVGVLFGFGEDRKLDGEVLRG